MAALFLFALNLVMVLSISMMLPKSWGTTDSYHKVSVVSHVHKNLLVVYSRQKARRFVVIESQSQSQGGVSRERSQTISLNENSAFSVCWSTAEDISSVKYLVLVDDSNHGPTQSSVDVYEGRANFDGLIIEYNKQSPSFKNGTIGDFCDPLGLKVEEIKPLLAGKKPKGTVT